MTNKRHVWNHTRLSLVHQTPGILVGVSAKVKNTITFQMGGWKKTSQVETQHFWKIWWDSLSFHLFYCVTLCPNSAERTFKTDIKGENNGSFEKAETMCAKSAKITDTYHSIPDHTVTEDSITKQALYYCRLCILFAQSFWVSFILFFPVSCMQCPCMFCLMLKNKEVTQLIQRTSFINATSRWLCLVMTAVIIPNRDSSDAALCPLKTACRRRKRWTI